jgi:GTP-binding protein HflX
VDASAPGVEEREAAVEAVLTEIGASERPRLVVLNKADAASPERREALLSARPGSVAVSALRGDGLDALLATVARQLDLTPRRVRLSFAAGDRRAVAGVYAAARVLAHEVVDGRVVLEAEISSRALERYRGYLG